MWPYVLVVAVISLFQFTKKEYNKITYFFMLMFLFLFAAFRGNGSGDYFEYLDRVDLLSSWNDVFFKNIGMEIGYKILAYSFKICGFHKQMIIIGMSTISIVCLNYIIKSFSVDIRLSLLLYLPLYFQFDMHAARTGVSILLSAVALTFYINRQRIKSIVFFLLSCSFHSAAIICLPIIFLNKFKFKRKTYLFLIILSLIFRLTVGLDYVIIKSFSLIGMSSFAMRYFTYANSDEYGYKFSLLDPRLLLLILVFLFSLIYIVKKDNILNNWLNKENLIFFNSLFFNIIILIIFSEHSFLAYRFSAYYNIYFIILVTRIIKEYNNSNKKIELDIKTWTVSLFAVYGLMFGLRLSFGYKLFFLP